GRRGGRHVTTATQAPSPSRRRWLVPAVAVVAAIAVVGAVVFSGKGSREEAAPAFSYAGEAQQTIAASQHWKFASARGDEVDGTMDAHPTKAATFGKDAAVTAVFPS